MNIVIRHINNEGLWRALTEQDIKILWRKNYMLIYPPWSGKKFLIPDGAADGEFLVTGSEIGGAHKRMGKARIICSLAGTPLASYLIQDRETTGFQGKVAKFSAPLGLVSVDASRKTNSISITRHLIARFDQTAWIQDQPIVKNLPLDIKWQCLTCGDFDGSLPKHRKPGEIEFCISGLRIKKLSLPQEIEIFRKAIEACFLKTNCYHCNHVHFSQY